MLRKLWWLDQDSPIYGAIVLSLANETSAQFDAGPLSRFAIDPPEVLERALEAE